MIYEIQQLADLYKAVQRLAKQYLPAEFEDLTQEIAVNLWSKRTRLPGRFSSGYLRSIVRNAACDMVRRERKRKQISYFSLNDNGSISIVGEPTKQFYVAEATTCDATETNFHLAHTLKALQNLTPEHRSAVELAAAGYNYLEIADLQAVPVGTVRSRIHYARKKLDRTRQIHNEK